MWLALFGIAIAAAIGLIVMVVILQPLAANRIDRWLSALGIDVLLERRMAVLGLDPADIMRKDARMFWQLEARCSLCLSKGRCARDLARGAGDPRDRRWRAYCPNATTLELLGRRRDDSVRLSGPLKHSVRPSH